MDLLFQAQPVFIGSAERFCEGFLFKFVPTPGVSIHWFRGVEFSLMYFTCIQKEKKMHIALLLHVAGSNKNICILCERSNRALEGSLFSFQWAVHITDAWQLSNVSDS